MSSELLAPRSPPRTKEILCPSHVLDSVSPQSARQRSDEVPALSGGRRSSALLTQYIRTVQGYQHQREKQIAYGDASAHRARPAPGREGAACSSSASSARAAAGSVR